jgi:hypothetical protein
MVFSASRPPDQLRRIRIGGFEGLPDVSSGKYASVEQGNGYMDIMSNGQPAIAYPSSLQIPCDSPPARNKICYFLNTRRPRFEVPDYPARDFHAHAHAWPVPVFLPMLTPSMKLSLGLYSSTTVSAPVK